LGRGDNLNFQDRIYSIGTNFAHEQQELGYVAGIVVADGDDVTTLSKGDHIVREWEMETFCLIFDILVV
jgi:hypothetical protein